MVYFPNFSITTDLLNIIINNSGLTEYVGDKIYPLIAPEGTEGSFIVYYKDKLGGKDYTNFGVASYNYNIWYGVLSDGYYKGQQIAEKLNNIIEGTHIINNHKYEIRLEDSTEDFQNKKYIQILVFSVN